MREKTSNNLQNQWNRLTDKKFHIWCYLIHLNCVKLAAQKPGLEEDKKIPKHPTRQRIKEYPRFQLSEVQNRILILSLQLPTKTSPCEMLQNKPSKDSLEIAVISWTRMEAYLSKDNKTPSRKNLTAKNLVSKMVSLKFWKIKYK